jgi:hypothetical protein
MSPARSKRQPVPHRHSRADIVKAVAVGGGIVVVTGLIVWLLRPGPPGIPATGGIMNRQPRASWLVVGALGLAGAATWFVLRGSRRTRSRAKVLLPTSFAVVAVAAVAGGFAWPGGLLRHDVAPKPAPKTTPTTTTKPGATTTTVAAGSGAAGSGATGSGATGSGATGSGAPEGGTSEFGSTGPQGLTPTTGTPATGSK